MTIIGVVALIAVIFWEWYHKDPIIDLHLFKDRSFAVGNMLMFMVGFALAVEHRAIPAIYCRTLMGYTAERAGLALMPGGIAIILCMPLVGFLLGQMDARRLLLFRLVHGLLLYVPHDAFRYPYRFPTPLPRRACFRRSASRSSSCRSIRRPTHIFRPDKNNAASGLINLSRNIGGSVGISWSPRCSLVAHRCIKTTSRTASTMETPRCSARSLAPRMH